MVKLLQKDKIEVRRAFFLEAFGRDVENMSIISFGRCNFSCIYCKRDGQFKDENDNIINSVDCNLEELKEIADKEILKGRRIRLSGGDPCVCLKESLFLAQYIFEKYNQKISIAHNGSFPKLVHFLLPYLDYVAIDLKSPYPDEFAEITGIADGAEMIKRSLETQACCSKNGVLVDVRTCVFEHTTFDALQEIAKMIVEANNVNNLFWTLRSYNPVKGCCYNVPNPELLTEYIAEIKKIYPQLKMGMRSKWTGGFKIFD